MEPVYTLAVTIADNAYALDLPPIPRDEIQAAVEGIVEGTDFLWIQDNLCQITAGEDVYVFDLCEVVPPSE